MITPPCYDCTKRSPACWATCEGYKEFKKEHNEEMKARKHESLLKPRKKKYRTFDGYWRKA